MDPIDPIEDESKLPPIAALAASEQAPQIVANTEGALEEARVRRAVSDTAAVLRDAASALYTAELEDLQGVTEPDQPDDDRAAGRLDYARNDLISE